VPSEFEDRLRRKPPRDVSLSYIARRHGTLHRILKAGVESTLVFCRLGSHRGFSYPEGNFEENQLLGDSMSLSPLHQTQTNELHVSIDTSYHRSFPRLRCSLE